MAKIDDRTKAIRSYFKKLMGLSGRSCNVAFFIKDFNGWIISNPTKAGQNSVFGDRITKYGVGELTYHFVEFKDKLVFDNLTRWIVGDLEGADVVIIDLRTLSSVMNKFSFDEVNIGTYGNCRVISNWAELSGKNEVKEVAYILNERQIYSSLRDTLEVVKSIGTGNHRATHSHMVIPVDINIAMQGREYVIVIDPSKLTGDNPIKQCKPIKLNVVDGLTIPSITKQFISSGYSKFETYVWAEDEVSMSLVTDYDSSDMLIRTYPVNLRLIAFHNLETTWEQV